MKIDKIKKEINALYIAYKRKDIPWYAKLLIAIVVGYALSPIDLIPDFIPLIGYLDDIIFIPLGITLAIKLIPKDIMEECRAEANNISGKPKKKNWIAAVIILLFWLAIISFIVLKIAR